MIKTFLQWHRTADVLPDDEILVVTAFPDGDVTSCFLMDGQWWSPDAFPTSGPPQWWADFPVGPRDPEAAALAEPEPEPVAWMVFTQDGQSVFVTDNPTDIGEDQRALPLYTTPPARSEPESVAWQGLEQWETDELARDMVKAGKSVNWLAESIAKRLRDRNERPITRRPLTDEEIAEAWAEVMLFPQRNKTHMDLARSFARAIERAHGIGGNDE